MILRRQEQGLESKCYSIKTYFILRCAVLINLEDLQCETKVKELFQKE